MNEVLLCMGIGMALFGVGWAIFNNEPAAFVAVGVFSACLAIIITINDTRVKESLCIEKQFIAATRTIGKVILDKTAEVIVCIKQYEKEFEPEARFFVRQYSGEVETEFTFKEIFFPE